VIGPLRVVILGVSHWHAPLYYRPAARLAGVRIVGVSDPDPSVAERVGRELGAPSFVDDHELLDRTRPQFAFAFGRHCDLPDITTALIDAGVPCVVEKPAGLNATQVAGLRDHARRRGVAVGTGFNFRVSDWYKRLRQLTADDPASLASFRFISGPPQRYHELGCPWMLDPALAGGGSTINLAGHLIDLFRGFTASQPTDVQAHMSHATWGLPIEDHSLMVLRSDRAAGTIETGYAFPGELGRFDLHFSLRTARYYIVVRADDVVEITDAASGQRDVLRTPTSNLPWYPAFVAESLQRAQHGLPPVADLDDLLAAMRVIDAAYAASAGGAAAVRPRDPDAGGSG
jgi:predicted dehydrogenase